MNDRTCIVTREARPAEELIRFVAAPDGRVVPDLKASLPGRGAWVIASAAMVDRAVRKGAFQRALKAPVVAAPDLADEVRRLIEKRALEALGLAARAGVVVAGFAKVEERARSGRLGLVFVASDAAPDGARKILAAAAAGDGAPRIVRAFTSAQLGLALGRPNVVHAGVAPGRVATSLDAAVTRYERYCDGGATDARAA